MICVRSCTERAKHEETRMPIRTRTTVGIRSYDAFVMDASKRRSGTAPCTKCARHLVRVGGTSRRPRRTCRFCGRAALLRCGARRRCCVALRTQLHTTWCAHRETARRCDALALAFTTVRGARPKSSAFACLLYNAALYNKLELTRCENAAKKCRLYDVVAIRGCDCRRKCETVSLFVFVARLSCVSSTPQTRSRVASTRRNLCARCRVAAADFEARAALLRRVISARSRAANVRIVDTARSHSAHRPSAHVAYCRVAAHEDDGDAHSRPLRCASHSASLSLSTRESSTYTHFLSANATAMPCALAQRNNEHSCVDEFECAKFANGELYALRLTSAQRGRAMCGEAQDDEARRWSTLTGCAYAPAKRRAKGKGCRRLARSLAGRFVAACFAKKYAHAAMRTYSLHMAPSRRARERVVRVPTRAVPISTFDRYRYHTDIGPFHIGIGLYRPIF